MSSGVKAAPAVSKGWVARLVSFNPTLTGVVPTAPPENVRFLIVEFPIAVASTVSEALFHEASWRAWLMVACIDSTACVIAVRPLSAAFRVLMPFDIESRIDERSEARDDRADEVKKFVGLSRAELTFLPVARRFCVVPNRLAVFCRASRFCRTPADRVMLEAMTLNLSGRVPYWRFQRRSRWIGRQQCHGWR